MTRSRSLNELREYAGTVNAPVAGVARKLGVRDWPTGYLPPGWYCTDQHGEVRYLGADMTRAKAALQKMAEDAEAQASG